MKFWKIHNNGNNFIFIFNEITDNYSLLAQKICNQSFGIGADGLIALNKSENTYKILFYNADGSEANLCGNGLLCAGRLINKFFGDKKILFKTTLDEIRCIVTNNQITIKMPEIKAKSFNVFTINDYLINIIDIGNIHGIIFTSDIDDIDLDELYEKVDLPLNLSIASVVDRKNVVIRTYEYGVGETFSCGSGATATYIASRSIDKVDDKVDIKSIGGTLNIEYIEGSIMLSGNPRIVCEGELFND